jgi:hypothetical protein
MTRIILDTNLWSSIGDEMVARQFDALVKSHSLEVIVPPSTLIEVMRLPVIEARDRIIYALGTGPRIRLPTEAMSESNEVVAEIRRKRPHWMRNMPDTTRVWSLNNFWTKKIWRSALERSQPYYEHSRRQTAEYDAIIRSQRIQRAERIRTDFKAGPLTDIKASLSVDHPAQNYLPGWSGEPVEAWRVACGYLYWHQLVVVSGRALFTKEDPTFADWIGAYVDLSRLRSSHEDFTRFWIYDVSRDAVPRNWLRWAVNFVQTDFKITSGNPADEQHSSYLMDCDIFLSADARYISVLEIIREDSPFKIAEPRLVSGDRTVPVLDRLKAAL